MSTRRIAHVGDPLVCRKIVVESPHHPVALRLCDYGGGRYREACSISLDYRLVRKPAVWKRAIAIDEEVCRLRPQSVDCAAHRLHRSPQYIQLVYLGRRAHSDRYRDGMLADDGRQFLSHRRSELLAVVQAVYY